MFLKSSLLMTSGLGFDTYVREEVREERVQVKKPHVILIMTDQHRGDALGCMGNSAVISPNLDRLAKEGTLFVNGYSASPSSTPMTAAAQAYSRPLDASIGARTSIEAILMLCSRI